MSALAHLVHDRARAVVGIAIAVFLVAAVLGTPLVASLKATTSDFVNPAAPSQQAATLVREATGQNPVYGLVALVGGGDVRTSATVRARVARVEGALRAQPGFQRLLDYPRSHNRILVSRDGSYTVVLAAYDTATQAGDAATRAADALRDPAVRFGGVDVAFQDINKRVSHDLASAEELAVPIIVLLSFLIFRGLVAALLPPLVGGFAIVLTFLLMRLVDQFVGLSVFAVNLVTGMGLGLAIDYSLFILSRHREELAGGASEREAIQRTLQTAGRTVLFSAVTVAGALASLLVFPQRFLYSMGVGGALVSLAAGGVSLIVLPALLVVLGPRVNALAPARLQRSRERSARPASEGGWFALASGVLRRPGAVALVTFVVLAAVASPALGLRLVQAGSDQLPVTSQARVVADALSADFAGNVGGQVLVVARASGPRVAQLRALAGRIARLPEVGAAEPLQSLGRDVYELQLLPRGGESGAESLVRSIRSLPSATPLLVGGTAATFIDQKHAVAASALPAVAILALVTLGMLFLMSGSLVLPLVALAMNMLTVGVAAGILVLIFQDGHLSSLLGFAPAGGLEESNLVLLFVAVFALSTDYGVFLFGRIKESHDSGLETRAAVALGLERTGRLVTAAALLFCVAVGAFTTSSIVFIKQFGLGTALGVAIDATFVRALLVPALMGVLGDRSWWAPRGLRRLHSRVGLRESPAQ